MKTKSFDEILNEKKGTELNTLEDIEAALKPKIEKLFPNSFLKFGRSSLGGGDLLITFTLGKNKSQWEAGIANNDPFYTSIFIWASGPVKAGIPLGNLKLETEMSRGGSYWNHKWDFMAVKRVKLGWRKKIATPDKLVTHIENYFKKMKKFIDNDKDAIDQKNIELSKR